MRRIFHQNIRTYDTAVRVKAMNILLENNPVDTDIKQIVLSITDQDQHELSTFIYAKIYSMMENDEKIRLGIY